MEKIEVNEEISQFVRNYEGASFSGTLEVGDIVRLRISNWVDASTKVNPKYPHFAETFYAEVQDLHDGEVYALVRNNLLYFDDSWGALLRFPRSEVLGIHSKGVPK